MSADTLPPHGYAGVVVVLIVALTGSAILAALAGPLGLLPVPAILGAVNQLVGGDSSRSDDQESGPGEADAEDSSGGGEGGGGQSGDADSE